MNIILTQWHSTPWRRIKHSQSINILWTEHKMTIYKSFTSLVSPPVSRHLKCDLSNLRLLFRIPWCIGLCSDMVVMPSPISLIIFFYFNQWSYCLSCSAYAFFAWLPNISINGLQNPFDIAAGSICLHVSDPRSRVIWRVKAADSKVDQWLSGLHATAAAATAVNLHPHHLASLLLVCASLSA